MRKINLILLGVVAASGLIIGLVLGAPQDPCAPYAENPFFYSECINKEAMNAYDETLCDNLKMKGLPREFIDSCYSSVGRFNLDEDICQLVADPTERDNCFFIVAIDGREPLICALVEHPVAQNTCNRMVFNATGQT